MIKQKILILIFVLILYSSFASAALTASNTILYYSFNGGDLNNSASSSYTGLNSGTTNASGFIGDARDFSGTAQYIEVNASAGMLGGATGSGTVNVWAYPDTLGAEYWIAGIWGHGNNEFLFKTQAASKFEACFNGCVSMVTSAAALPATGQWYMLTLTWNTTGMYLYINGTYSATTVNTKGAAGATRMVLGMNDDGDTSYFNGKLDEISIWNVSLSATDISALYNSGSGLAYPFSTAATNFSVTATDEITGASLNISVWVDGTSYGTNTTVTTDLLSNSTTLHNVTVGAANYFNRTYTNLNISSNLAASLHQAEVCFNATEKISGAAVTLNNVTINSTARTVSPFCFNVSASTINAKAQKTGWFSRNQSYTIAALSNATETVLNMSYANLTISAKDGSTNATLTGYTLTINSLNFSGWPGETAAGVTNYSFYLINGTYNISIDVPGYELTNAQANITVNGNTNYTFTLYKENSIRIFIYDEITNAPILTNITIRFSDNSTTWENTTTTSQSFVYNITPSVYTILFYGSGYSTRTYTVTVGNRTTQTLNAYMISSNYSTTFTIKDVDSGDTLSNVSISMYKQVNSSWVVVESKFSDISGRALFYYDPIGSYKFYLSLIDYNDYVFFLNPILFSSYDVYMSQTSLLNATQDYDGVAVIYAPNYFANNENTTFNFIISSPDGLLTEYGINLTHPGGSVTDTGVNAIGSQLTAWVNITGATAYDRVRLDYYYISSTTGRHDFVAYFPIAFNISVADNTFLSNKNKTYGLGIFERILIVTLIVLFIVGIGTLVGQPIPAMALGLFCFGYMAFIGFVHLWAILPSMFIGVLFLVWKSGGY